MSQAAKDFAELLTNALHRIKEETKQPIYEIEDELSIPIRRSRETLEKWRRGNLPADLEQVKIVAGMLFEKKGLANRAEFELLLSYAGHPRPASAWQELFSPPQVDIPTPDDHFIEREDKLNELLRALQDTEVKVLSLCGPGGIGKTALVTAALQKLTPNREPPRIFSDGILYYNFYGRFSIDDAFRYIANFFGVKVSKETAPRDAARLSLRNRQALIVLDGAEEAENLQALLEIRDTTKILIVTRYEHVARGRRVIHLDPPQNDLAIQIFRAWSKSDQDEPELLTTDDNDNTGTETANEICELVGFLPLALRLAGRYMSQCHVKPSEYLELLKGTTLAVLHEDERQHASVSVLLDKIIEKIRKEAHPVLAVIGLLTYNSFNLEVIASALNSTTTAIVFAIGELVRFGMVKRLSDGRYQVIHRLVHTYATERVAVPPAALTRLATYYSRLVHEQTKLGGQGYARLNVERPHFIEIVEKCLKQGEWAHVWNLAYAMQAYLHFQHRITDLIKVNNAALSAAWETRNPQKQGEWLTILGNMYFMLGRYADAFSCHNKAVTICKESGDSSNLARCLLNLGIASDRCRRFNETVTYYEQALKITRELNQQDTEGKILLNWANAEAKKGRLDAAINLYQKALNILREIGDDDTEGDCLGNLAIAFDESGQVEQAHDYFQQTLALYRSLGDRYGEGRWLRQLGLFYNRQHELEKAIGCFKEVLAIGQEIGDRHSEGEALESLGNLRYNQEQYIEAIAYYEQALKVALEIDAQDHIVWIQCSIGDTYSAQGDLKQAIEYYNRTLEICTKFDKFDQEIAILRLLGSTHFQMGQAEQAIGYYHQAIDKTRDIGDVDTEVIYLNQLGELYENLTQVEQAIEHYQQAVLLAFKIGEFELGDAYLQRFATYCGKHNCPDRMIGVLKEITEMYPRLPKYHHYLGNYYLRLEKVDDAEKCYFAEAMLQKDSLAAYIALGVIKRYHGQDAESRIYFERALSIWNQKASRKSVSELDIRLLTSRFWIVLGLDQKSIGAFVFLRKALAEYNSWDFVWFSYYKLFANSPNPPSVLSEVTRLLEEAGAKLSE